MNPEKPSILICGAGAAGLTAAIFAAGAGALVTLLERTDKAGKKILMSGGTRCNVLPVFFSVNDYTTGSSPRRMEHIFRSWPLDDCKNWFTDEIGLKLKCEMESNKWFPESNSAKEVRNLLLEKALKSGVKIRYNFSVESVFYEQEKWTVKSVQGEKLSADKLIISTGGLSIPTIGTDGMGHRFMKNLGHKTGPVYPALTPLKGDDNDLAQLAGISLNVMLDVYQDGKKVTTSERDGFLFTHQGYSGPSVLDVSHYAVRYLDEDGRSKPEYRVNWDGASAEEWKNRLVNAGGNVISVLKMYLPNRLAEFLCRTANLDGKRAAEISKKDRQNLIRLLTAYPIPVSGHEGYRKAEVTGGGIPLEEIDTATLESKHCPGLYLCGEILDVFGRIGGFNFYWAWVTGRLSGVSAAGRKG